MLRSAALAYSVVASMPTVLPVTNPASAPLQHPCEHRLVRLEIDRATRAGNRRMIRRCVRQHQPEELAQRKRVGRTPRDGALRVQPFEVPDQQQPDVAARRETRAANLVGHRTADTVLRRSRRSPRCREFDSVACRTGARPYVAGLGPPPTSRSASADAVACQSPCAAGYEGTIVSIPNSPFHGLRKGWWRRRTDGHGPAPRRCHGGSWRLAANSDAL
jgi:hypothetical protein